jgi:hypothetical protein
MTAVVKIIKYVPVVECKSLPEPTKKFKKFLIKKDQKSNLVIEIKQIGTKGS